jgi:hypothetical protein
MNTVRKILVSDDAGTVHVDVLGAAPRRKVEVVVTWQELEAPSQSWPADWIDSTCGSIDDPTFVRPSQGEFEQREPLA